MVEFEPIEGPKMKVYPPTVTIQNNIFPPKNELRNCTTCGRGRRLPQDIMDEDFYHYHCSWVGPKPSEQKDLRTAFQHTGDKRRDNGCEFFVRKRRE
jgi:hypothetical protein